MMREKTPEPRHRPAHLGNVGSGRYDHGRTLYVACAKNDVPLHEATRVHAGPAREMRRFRAERALVARAAGPLLI